MDFVAKRSNAVRMEDSVEALMRCCLAREEGGAGGGCWRGGGGARERRVGGWDERKRELIFSGFLKMEGGE